MLIKQVHAEAAVKLAEAGIVESSLEAELLLRHILVCSRSEFFLRIGENLSPSDTERFAELLSRRLAREPLAYLIGEQEFWSLPFIVSPSVLIPRPETEELIERVLSAARQGSLPPGPVLDLGAGSGAIAIVLALELAERQIFGVDFSFAALTVARENIQRHLVEERVFLINGDWLSPIRPERKFALLVANPPYIAEKVVETLQPEVRDFEPRLALSGGADGLDAIRILADQARMVMLPGAWFFMEIGFDQGEAALNIFSCFPEYDRVRVHSDLAGLPRVLQARRC